MAITEKKLEDWARKHDLKRLHKALSEPNYQIRLKAIAHLAQIRNRESLPYLERLIDDAFISVLKEAFNAIRSITPNHSALAGFKKRILEKEELEARRKARTEAKFEPHSEEEERRVLEQKAKDYDVMKIYQTGLKEERKRTSNWWLATSISVGAGAVVTLLYYLFYVL